MSYISGYDIKYKIFKNISKDLIQKLHNGQIFEFPLIFHSMTGKQLHTIYQVMSLSIWNTGSLGPSEKLGPMLQK